MGDDGLDYEGSLRLTEVVLMPLAQIGSSSSLVSSNWAAGCCNSSAVSRRLSNLEVEPYWKAAWLRWW